MSLQPVASSLNDTTFISRGLLEGSRVDGRTAKTARPIICGLRRGENRSSSEVALGGTRVIASVIGEISAPYEERPQEGFLTFNVEVLASASVDWADSASRRVAPPVATRIARILERQIRDSRAIDMESLCIIPGEKVWSLRCDIRVVEDFGNLTDAASAAALSALLHFRRPEVTVRGASVTIHPTWERPPVALAVHHTPLTLTYACMTQAGACGIAEGGGGEILLRDPTSQEESVCTGSVSICMNAHGELCGLHKLGGCPISVDSLLQLVRDAAAQAPALISSLRNAGEVVKEEADSGEEGEKLEGGGVSWEVPRVI